MLSGCSDDRQVFRSRALLAVDYIKLDACTFGEGLETFALDRAVVAEHVFLTVIARNETKIFFVVEPLN